MKNKKKVTLLVSITLVLLVTLLSTAYAWFSARVINPEDQIDIGSANLGKIKFYNGDTIDVEDVWPGWCETKKVSVEAENLTKNANYIVYLNVVTNELATLGSSLGYMTVSASYIPAESAIIDGTVGSLEATNLTQAQEKKAIIMGTLYPDEIHTYDVTFCFPNLDTPQNSQGGKAFNAYITLETTNTETYTIVYNLNGGTASNPTSYTTFDFTITLNNPTREGYTFIGWDASSGTIDGNSFIVDDSNATITPKWQVNNYNYIVYHKKQGINGGYEVVDTNTGNAAFNTSVSPNTKEYIGFTSPQKKTITISSNTNTNVINYEYTRNKYTLTINPQGGSTPTTLIQELKYGESIQVVSPTKPGYNFTNWTKSSGTLVDETFTMGASNATLTTKWEAKKYNITFNGNGGTTREPNTLTRAYGEELGGKGSTTTIYYPKTISLSKTAFTYSGKVQKPTVKVVGSDGKTIASSNYTVSYSNKNSKNVGEFTVTITFKGNYTGSIVKTFKITAKAILKTIIDNKEYIDAKKRILFITKEAYIKDKKDSYTEDELNKINNLIDDFKNEVSGIYWRRLSQWAYGIQNTGINKIPSLYNEITKDKDYFMNFNNISTEEKESRLSKLDIKYPNIRLTTNIINKSNGFILS